MTGAYLERPRHGIVGIYMMTANNTAAGAGGVAEQERDDTLSVTGEFTPPLAVVHRLVHRLPPPVTVNTPEDDVA
jgi:hypothetical protein